jgi:uncharacterized protein
MPRPSSLLLTPAFLLLALPLAAASSVWKVSKGERSLYLGGTCHVLRATDFPLPAEFDAAYAASSVLYFETDIGRAQSPEMQQIVARQGMFTDGTTLEKALTPAAWKAVLGHCERLGIPPANFATMKPWMFTVVIAVVEMQKLQLTLEGVDMHYHKKATTDKKQSAGLETFENHIKYITTMGAGHESEMVANTIEELAEMPALVGELLTAWKTGNIAKIDEIMLKDMRAKYPAIFQSLLVDRNNAWLPKIEDLLKTPEVEFVLVGAGHMAGPEGLLALLKARGYTIEQTVVKN